MIDVLEDLVPIKILDNAAWGDAVCKEGEVVQLKWVNKSGNLGVCKTQSGIPIMIREIDCDVQYEVIQE